MGLRWTAQLWFSVGWCGGLAGQTGLGWDWRGGADLAFRTRYVWRGVTRTSGWVLQPDAFVALQKHAAILTMGAWTNVDLGSTPGLALPQQWFGETDGWVEAATRLGGLNLAGGWTFYHFRSIAADTTGVPIANTSEFYARAELEAIPDVVPRLAVWYDVARVKGTYLEGSVRLRVPLWASVEWPLGSLFVTALGGYSAGQERNPANPAQGFYFANHGLAFFDVSPATTVGYLPVGRTTLAFHVAYHLQRNLDPLTKRTNVDPAAQNATWQHWFDLTVSVALPRCRPTRRLCGS